MEEIRTRMTPMVVGMAIDKGRETTTTDQKATGDETTVTEEYPAKEIIPRKAAHINISHNSRNRLKKSSTK